VGDARPGAVQFPVGDRGEVAADLLGGIALADPELDPPLADRVTQLFDLNSEAGLPDSYSE
jgi:hypothetical protein